MHADGRFYTNDQMPDKLKCMLNKKRYVAKIYQPFNENQDDNAM